MKDMTNSGMHGKKKLLLLFAHPSLHRSEINSALFKKAKQLEGVTCVDLYAEYPKFNIDINKEQQRLLEHDLIVFLFPLYWYSTPSILKEWQDLVLEYGFAYGDGGDRLTGKGFFCAVSAGGREEAYQSDGYNHFSIRELLHPLEQVASLTGMKYLPPFVLFGSRNAIEENRVESHLLDWEVLLKALLAEKLDIEKAKNLPQLSGYLDVLIKGGLL